MHRTKKSPRCWIAFNCCPFGSGTPWRSLADRNSGWGALLSEKPVLIFDEPTSGLDYARMVEVSGVIRDLARQGRIVLVVTHDQEFLQQACDRVLHL